MPTRHFAVHGHFYQPPRIDPFSNRIPQEYGAASYGNWTEKIYRQCYEPNAKQGNFEKISFDVGPTLFSWMEAHHASTVQEIIQQERMVFQRSGVSNAMAHPYFHLIFPLASRRDKDTMLQWGIRDYETHFGHKPDGLWLPETAVDCSTLDALVDHEITFTILAPWQAEDEGIDTTQAHIVSLTNGKKITVFFYNSFLSGELSFNPSASLNADAFVSDWLIPQSEYLSQDHEQLFLAASDGELYGHHREYRDQFLSHLLDGAVEANDIARTYPALWLRNHPPVRVVKIRENTSWSCHHGIERWRDVCGDAPSATWKKPLRQFLDALCNAIDEIYEDRLADLVHDPWALRDQYVEVLLGNMELEQIIDANRKKDLDGSGMQFVKIMLRAEFERLRMLSSDAWFFYDLDRIEPLNALKYAAHAASLVESATGADPSNGLVSIIAQAKSERSGVTGDMAFLGFLKKFEKLGDQEPTRSSSWMNWANS